ncbi:hypothetical protein BGP77_09345 [Saccharospirillum sp. MSK14-1]|nr:hypothetical protein BGP77_09345 [Saccharospirillum sp. MSK14-1]
MAVFGGTFDPFHRTHEWLCQAVLANTDVSQLRLVPCQLPALKAAAQASPEDRLGMLHAWAKTQQAGDRLVIDRRELDRPGPSYSRDTLAALQQEFPTWRRVFVMGADAFASLARWDGVDDLIRSTHFWVFPRGNEPIIVPELPLQQVQQLSDLDLAGGCWLAGPATGSELSSTSLRRGEMDWQAELPEPVYHYIKTAGLYRPSFH